MQPDTIKAQVATLAEWADQFERQAAIRHGAGCEEIAYLLRRVGGLMLRAIGEDALVMHEVMPRAAPSVEQARDD